MKIEAENIKDIITPKKWGAMWYSIAFGLSLIIPTNGICLSLWHGFFGRLYIAYWLIVYHEMYLPMVKKLITLIVVGA